MLFFISVWSFLLEFSEWNDIQQFMWTFVILFTGVISFAGFKTWEKWQ